MDLRRERRRSLKVREQQETELERIQATKKRYSHGIGVFVSTVKFIILHFCRRCQKDAEAKGAKRQSPIVRQKEAEAKAVKRQSPSVRKKEAEAKAAKRQLETPIEKEQRRQKDATSKKR